MRPKSAPLPVSEDGATPEPWKLNLGARLRQMRRAQGLTLKNVADGAGCSESLLSKLENNKVVPSMHLLRRLCAALDTTMGKLLADQTDGAQVITRAGERAVVNFDPVRPGYRTRMERLAPCSPGVALQGNIHVIAPGGGSEGLITHEGQEVGYVISGSLELILGDNVYALAVGDSFFFQSTIPHGYRNVGDDEARIIFINTPPTF